MQATRAVTPAPNGDGRWQEELDKTTRLLFSMSIRVGPDRPHELARDWVIAMARMALQPESEVATRTTTRLPGPDGSLVETPCITCPGTLRLTFMGEVADWSSPMVAESIMAVVERALEDELRRPEPGMYPPGDEPWN